MGCVSDESAAVEFIDVVSVAGIALPCCVSPSPIEERLPWVSDPALAVSIHQVTLITKDLFDETSCRHPQSGVGQV